MTVPAHLASVRRACIGGKLRQVNARAALAVRRLAVAEAELPAALAVFAGRRVLAEVASVEGYARRRAECAAMHALRSHGWRPLPTGEWFGPRGERLESVTAAAAVALRRVAREAA